MAFNRGQISFSLVFSTKGYAFRQWSIIFCYGFQPWANVYSMDKYLLLGRRQPSQMFYGVYFLTMEKNKHLK